jgi:hypothetical protein
VDAYLGSELNLQPFQSRLVCHLVNDFDAIYVGEKTGIHVMHQDNLLIGNYESSQVYWEGNRRLASIIDILAHKTPNMRILKVGAGTRSATEEILLALQELSLYSPHSTGSQIRRHSS